MMDDIYVIWDKLENRIHRGPWTQQECLVWMDQCRRIMPRSLGVDEVFEIQQVELKKE